MLGFAEKVVLYTDGLDQEKFVASEIDWRQIIGTRNRLVHGYLGINNDIVWDIIQNEIPVLITRLEALIKAANGNQIR